MKKQVAKTGKKLLERTVFAARRALVEPLLDARRDSTLISWATYSPWLQDPGFLACHATIRTHTLVDLYRCYELWHLVAQTSPLQGDLLEVGTWRGGTGCLMARRASALGFDATVYLCDTFTGVTKSSAADDAYSDGEHADTSESIVTDLAAQLELKNVRILRGTFPEDTSAAIENRSFRLCHIDVDVYRSAKDVLDWVWPRLAVGGIVVFDDFGFASTTGITQLVHDEEGRSDLVCVQNLNGHAVFVKTG